MPHGELHSRLRVVSTACAIKQKGRLHERDDLFECLLALWQIEKEIRPFRPGPGGGFRRRESSYVGRRPSPLWHKGTSRAGP